jgi:hypothetical protein
MRALIAIVVVGIWTFLLLLCFDAALPRQPLPTHQPPPGVREVLTPEQCRMMAEHLRRDHGMDARVLTGAQVITGPFVWQDLTLELIGHPGFVFSYPHYLGNLNSQEVYEEIK